MPSQLEAPTLYSISGSAASSVFDLPVHSVTRLTTPTPTPSLSTPDRRSAEFNDSTESPRVLVISGGTGCNSICSAFGRNTAYALPVSDNGGSSAEIIRVIGGPSIGDIRSRLVRLIPDNPSDGPLNAIRRLFGHRISPNLSEEGARSEWRGFVEGTSDLWKDIPSDRKETIRGFLVYFENELLKRADKRFSFRNGSIGNYFLAGAQLFFRSLPSAIFLFSSITTSQANILPVIVTNHTVTIAAALKDGATLVGQCEISHPVSPDAPGQQRILRANEGEPAGDGLETVQLPTQNVSFSKADKENEDLDSLSAPISRLFYINAYGQETRPRANAEYIRSCGSSELLVYSCGSLWTSIVPCLALSGVGKAIAESNSLRAKVLLLNSKNDRETQYYTATHYVQVVTSILNEMDYPLAPAPASTFITHLVYLHEGVVEVDFAAIEQLGIRCVGVNATTRDVNGIGYFDPVAVREALKCI